MSEVAPNPSVPARAVPRPSPRGSALAGHPLAQLTLVRFLEFLREPEALFWVFIFPVLLAAGLGLAFRNRPPDVLKIAAVTPHLAAALKQEKLLDVQWLSVAAAERALREGKVALVATPDPRILRGDVSGLSGETPGAVHELVGVVYEYDDTNPEGRTARMLADRAIQRAAGRVDVVESNDRMLREPGSRYIDFLIPGLLGMNLMGGSIWGLGFTIVDARRKKLIKRLVATPMPRHYYLLSFALSRLIMLVLEVVVLLGFGALVFHVPVRGSLADMGVLCVLGALSFGAIGLLIASRVQTIEAANGLMNLVMLPMWIVSGVFFSAQRFPDLLQPVIKVLPLTAIIDALRANMLQGAGFAQLAPQMAILGCWMVVCFTLALRIFRWR
jgi:ABC-type multidrug transport system permease subunit